MGIDNFPIKNFANSAYREARILADRLGPTSTSKQIIIDGFGNKSLLEMRNGMPRTTPILKRQIAAPTACPIGMGPITEGMYASREFHASTSFANEDMIFSYDGIYSIGRAPVKAMSVTLGVDVTKVWMTFANPATPATDTQAARTEVKAVRKTPCDLVEIARTMTNIERNWVIVKNGRQLTLFSHQEINTIDFERPRELVPTVTRLRFNNPPTAYNGSMVAKEIGGIHNNIQTLRTAGVVTELRQSRQYATIPQSGFELTNGILYIYLSSPGQFLEPWAVEALITVGAQTFPSSPYAPVFPVTAEFGTPFKCFHTTTGLFTDETKVDQITTPLVTGVTTGTLPVYNPNEDYKIYPRYFNFTKGDFVDPLREGLRPNYPVPGTKAVLKGDVQYQFRGGSINGGYIAAPGMAIDLKAHQHFYKDPAGRVWLINFEWQHTVAHKQIVRVTLYRRFDPIFEPTRTPVLAKILIEQEIPFEYCRPKYAGSYRPLGSDSWLPMAVQSLPNGTEACGLCIVSGAAGARLTRVGLSTLFETSVVTGCIRVSFAGTGAVDGSGITATMEVLTIWKEDTTTPVPVTNTGQSDSRSSVVTGTSPSPVVTTETVGISSSGNHNSSNLEKWTMLLGLSPTVDNQWEESLLSSEELGETTGQTVQTGSGSTDYTVYYLGIPSPTLTGNFNHTIETSFTETWKRKLTLVRGLVGIEYRYEITGVMTSGSGRSMNAVGVNNWNGTLTSHLDVDYSYFIGDFVGAAQQIIDSTNTPVTGTTSSGYSYADPRINYPPSPILFNPVNGQSATFPNRNFRYANPVLTNGGIECGTISGDTFTRTHQSLTKLYAGFEFSVDQASNCLCHDPRNSRVYVAPDSSSAGAFY